MHEASRVAELELRLVAATAQLVAATEELSQLRASVVAATEARRTRDRERQRRLRAVKKAAAVAATPCSSSCEKSLLLQPQQQPADRQAEAFEVLRFHADHLGFEGPIGPGKDMDKVVALLAAGFTVDQLKRVVESTGQCPWRGHPAQRGAQRACVIFRDADQAKSLLARWRRPPPPPPPPPTPEEIAAQEAARLARLAEMETWVNVQREMFPCRLVPDPKPAPAPVEDRSWAQKAHFRVLGEPARATS